MIGLPKRLSISKNDQSDQIQRPKRFGPNLRMVTNWFETFEWMASESQRCCFCKIASVIYSWSHKWFRFFADCASDPFEMNSSELDLHVLKHADNCRKSAFLCSLDIVWKFESANGFYRNAPSPKDPMNSFVEFKHQNSSHSIAGRESRLLQAGLSKCSA